MKPKILLVYAAFNHPLRANTRHLIECFRQYGDAHWFYVNLAHKRAASYVRNIEFDLVIFQTSFVQRLSRGEDYYRQMTCRAEKIRTLSAPKVALVQDEFWNVEKVERFIDAFGIEVVFSVAPESEWAKLYPSIDRAKVHFHRVLAGYIDEASLDGLISAGASGIERTNDIVYRAAGSPSPAWGRFGYMKQRLADSVLALAPKYNLRVDISTNPRDTLFGDKWINFLASARYTIGAPSGSSLLDRDGSIAACVDRIRLMHPDASFEDIERHCFPGHDGNLNLSAIGPRHLEACATRTCQILVEGDYNDLLKPNVHYIAVKEDLSNLQSVLAMTVDENLRRKIAERAFDDLVRPGRLTYRKFVNEVIEASLPKGSIRNPSSLTRREFRLLIWMRAVERLEWLLAVYLSTPIRKMRDLLRRSK